MQVGFGQGCISYWINYQFPALAGNSSIIKLPKNRCLSLHLQYHKAGIMFSCIIDGLIPAFTYKNITGIQLEHSRPAI